MQEDKKVRKSKKEALTYDEIRKFVGLVENLDEDTEYYYMANKLGDMTDNQLVDLLEKTKEYQLFMWKMLRKMGIVVRGDYDVEEGNNAEKHAYNALRALHREIEDKLIEREVMTYKEREDK